MIHNYLRVIHVRIEKIFIGNTRPSQDVFGTSTEDPLRVITSGPIGDLQGTLSGPIQKLIILWKMCFSEVIILVLHICFCFLQEEKIFKSSKRACPRDVYRAQFGVVSGTKWWDVLRTSMGRPSNMFLKLTHKYIQVTLTVYSRLYSEW